MKIFLGIIGLVILGIGVRALFSGTFILENVIPSISHTAGNILLIIISIVLIAFGFKDHKE
ncbi:hypothetical protein PDR89_25420 [Bacillus cereus group sp. Bc002]|uniref:hypothetical protein n=1 Tax=Bacillus TaxID=1386 RepID=UPI000346F77C|nr:MULTISPECIES: hypothetical protein [Bacillus cereus group]KXI55709.1 hypothetical protein ACS95_01695 [Bacillus cereus]MCC2391486.1 hypothetical protein [Bacillus pacificus]MCC2417046.1 hypothetical protein [Bacillus pacificus]MCU5004202.1 hypothetical protein [Bacillus pacificus]MCU5254931.1 hypothetical protein [Bacillus pacificus]